MLHRCRFRELTDDGNEGRSAVYDGQPSHEKTPGFHSTQLVDDFGVHEELNRQSTCTDDRECEANLGGRHSRTPGKAEGQTVVDTVRRRITEEIDPEYGVRPYMGVMYGRYHEHEDEITGPNPPERKNRGSLFLFGDGRKRPALLFSPLPVIVFVVGVVCILRVRVVRFLVIPYNKRHSLHFS